MSAIVSPVCGHASHTFEIDRLKAYPQIHLHFLTDMPEFQMLGYYKLELCCHGCGASLLVHYDVSEDGAKHVEIRDNFALRHRWCPDRGYDKDCPNFRSSFSFQDIRESHERSKDDIQLPPPQALNRPPRRIGRGPRSK